MNKMHFVVIFSLQIIFTLAESPMLLSTAIRLNKIVVSYPKGVISERDLNLCQERSSCNIIHKRFWLPPLIERLCRCPHRNECPWSWSDGDNQSINVNNRAQMKFCTDLSPLPNCTQKKVALTVSTLIPKIEVYAKNHTTLQKRDRFKRHTEIRNITVSCNCQEPHYWKLKMNSTKLNEDKSIFNQAYFCSKLKRCGRSDFCGYLRQDTHSTFYRCSCPKGHMCITRDKTMYQVDEILYAGYGYKAYCLPLKAKSEKRT